jgi:hypothetical protein
MILIDSSSCGNFISRTTVTRLGLCTEEVEAMTVQVADSGKTRISTAVSYVEWECQGQTFNNTFCVFDVPCYDIVLGMDWLHACDKMWIDWPKHSLQFRHKGHIIMLRGIHDRFHSCEPISMSEIHELIS